MTLTVTRGGIALVIGLLALACGSRSGLDACAFGDCPRPGLRARAEDGAGVRASAPGAAGEASGASADGAGQAGEGNAPEVPLPIVVLVVDASFSMFQRSVWTPMYEALMGADGPIARYEDQVRFGFASYRGPGQTSEEDPACAEIVEVPFAPRNTGEIRDTYGMLRMRQGYWETPTGHALTRVTDVLRAEPLDVRKYLLLFSDGAPDTCQTTRPQCGQDRAVFAVQEALRVGVETRGIGVGFGTEYDCDPEESRCGMDHFQDLANAGRGLPVEAPPAAYWTLPCAAETDGTLLAEYADEGGLAPVVWALEPEEVASAVDEMLAEIVAR